MVKGECEGKELALGEAQGALKKTVFTGASSHAHQSSAFFLAYGPIRYDKDFIRLAVEPEFNRISAGQPLLFEFAPLLAAPPLFSLSPLPCSLTLIRVPGFLLCSSDLGGLRPK